MGADNPLVRAIGHAPLPLGAKLLIGFGVVAALLAAGYLLGVVALGQSNSRGEQLRRLQQQAVYEKLLLTDTRHLAETIDYRIHFVPTAQLRAAYDETIASELNLLCSDAGIPNGCQDVTGLAALRSHGLRTVDPALFSQLVRNETGQPTISVQDRFAHAFAAQLSQLELRSSARANALVAADHSSFAASRNLLIGLGVGSLLLALALGFLLSWSVVVPLRRTRERLAAIAAGDFSDRLEVANRDEIGGLASDVNSMSDELQRVHGEFERVNRELEQASEHKSRFLANMSHELRTPLNAIIGFSDVLHEQMFGALNERQLAYVDDIREAGKHQLSLINEILDLAKIEAGRMELELGQVAIPDVLRAAVSMQAERASRGGVELTATTEPEEITITADQRRVRQVMFNLLSNALKFTPPQGRIDLSARLDGEWVEVVVADTGSGIPPEQLESIFEEFEQTSEGKQAEGTGLGLPLSRKLVELHGGRLWAESEPGHGSTFRFTLPVRPNTA